MLVGERERGLRGRRQPDPAPQQRADHLAGLGGRDELGGGERQHPPVQQAGREHQHVGREALPADVAALPDPPRADLVQRRGDLPAAQRAAGVVLAVRADEVGRLPGRLAGRTVERQVEQLGVRLVAAPPQRSRPLAAVDQRPAGARRPSASARAGGSPSTRIPALGRRASSAGAVAAVEPGVR